MVFPLSNSSNLSLFVDPPILTPRDKGQLDQGEILIQPQPYSFWGATVTAQIALKRSPKHLWSILSHYDQWVSIFPDVIKSQVLTVLNPHRKQICQSAQKQFGPMTIVVEAHLRVREYPPHRIWFQLEAPNESFQTFESALWLDPQPQDLGTYLTYRVAATPTLPIPSLFIQEAMRYDLPQNLRALRHYLEQS